MIQEGFSGAYIAGIDYALPDWSISNSEIAEQHPEWQLDQVVLRTGVESRYWTKPGETALDLGETACQKLFSRLGIAPEIIDMVLFCTQTPDFVMPPNACLIHDHLKLRRSIPALDFNLACSGFIYGLYIAKAMIHSNMAKHVLLVTAETYSKWMSKDDRGPATLFGDAAAATLVSSGLEGIGGFNLGTDGSSASSCFMIPAGGARIPRSEQTSQFSNDSYGNRRTMENIYMDGAAVLDFVKKDVPRSIKQLLADSGLTLEKIDLVVFHQASKITLDYLNRVMHIPLEKQFTNLTHLGNTVSASIPIALRDAEQQGKLQPGMRVLAVGFGVGLSWGSCLIDWN